MVGRVLLHMRREWASRFSPRYVCAGSPPSTGANFPDPSASNSSRVLSFESPSGSNSPLVEPTFARFLSIDRGGFADRLPPLSQSRRRSRSPRGRARRAHRRSPPSSHTRSRAPRSAIELPHVMVAPKPSQEASRARSSSGAACAHSRRAPDHAAPRSRSPLRARTSSDATSNNATRRRHARLRPAAWGERYSGSGCLLGHCSPCNFNRRPTRRWYQAGWSPPGIRGFAFETLGNRFRTRRIFYKGETTRSLPTPLPVVGCKDRPHPLLFGKMRRFCVVPLL